MFPDVGLVGHASFRVMAREITLSGIGMHKIGICEASLHVCYFI